MGMTDKLKWGSTVLVSSLFLSHSYYLHTQPRSGSRLSHLSVFVSPDFEQALFTHVVPGIIASLILLHILSWNGWMSLPSRLTHMCEVLKQCHISSLHLARGALAGADVETRNVVSEKRRRFARSVTPRMRIFPCCGCHILWSSFKG
jgi:hypothetical protein